MNHKFQFHTFQNQNQVKDVPNSKEEKYNNLIEKIGECLSLTKEESEKLRNLADSDLGAKGYLSNDMTDYIENVPLAMAALRKAKDANLTESEWNEIIKKIDNKQLINTYMLIIN